MRKTWLVAVMAFLLVMALPAGAQEDDGWAAYLFNQSDSGVVLLRIDNTGAQTEYQLDVPQDTFVNAGDIAFTPDGNTVAYCLTIFPPVAEAPLETPPMPTARVVVRDLAAATNTLALDLGEVSSCVASAISADGTRLAVGTMNYFPAPDVDTTGPLWTLRILDTATGQAVVGLTDDDPVADAVFLFGSDDDPILPRGTELTADSVTFQAFPGVGMGGPLEIPTFRWDFEAGPVEGSIVTLRELFTLNNDVLAATGEVVTPVVDPDLPTLEPGGPIPPYNTVALTDIEGNTRTIYTNTELIIGSTTFVNDGEAVALVMIPPFSPEMVRQDVIVGLVDRDGNYREVGSYAGFVVPFAAPGGFVLNYDVPQEGAPPNFYLEYHSMDGNVTPLWTYTTAPENFNFWQLIKVLG